ncbi:MAG TPA: pseudouridine synthase [Ilumatobacteraceae bacterium]|nr:pseudouridine synthase [Ilumatobacteraceae bacterium]
MYRQTRIARPSPVAERGPRTEARDVEIPLWEQWEAERALATGERLQKVLAARGWGSRRVCEDMIAAGRVRVNGEVAVLGRRVEVDTDVVEVDGVAVGVRPDTVYYLLNKPAGVITTASDTHGRPTVVELVPAEPRVFPVGRLDADTEGLLLLTNDGDLANRIMHPSHGVDKEYLVFADREASPSALRRLRDGVELDDGITAPATASQPQPGVIRLVIHEGRNRQVRRMCAAVGLDVQRLVRVRIGPLRDTNLAPGRFRTLTNAELRRLVEAVAEPPQRYDRRS